MSDESTIKLTKEEQAVIDALEKLNIVSVNNVVKYMEETYGISAAAPVAMAMPAGGAAAGGDAGGAPAEKTTGNVVLKEAGGNKIGVIKVVKDVTGLGLKEAKDLVDAAPKPIKENVKKEEADEIIAKLKEAGATAVFE